jgi:hypothetical protein
MPDYSNDPVRGVSGRLVKGMKAFQTVSKSDLVYAWRAHPATAGNPADADFDAIEECLHGLFGGKDGGGYIVYPSIADCGPDESFRIYRENTFFDTVRRWFTHPNRFDDPNIIELVQRMKGKWEDYPPRREGLGDGHGLVGVAPQ